MPVLALCSPCLDGIVPGAPLCLRFIRRLLKQILTAQRGKPEKATQTAPSFADKQGKYRQTVQARYLAECV